MQWAILGCLALDQPHTYQQHTDEASGCAHSQVCAIGRERNSSGRQANVDLGLQDRCSSQEPLRGGAAICLNLHKGCSYNHARLYIFVILYTQHMHVHALAQSSLNGSRQGQ